MFEAAGAVYNESTGFYELNGLTDITEEEMMKIYSVGRILPAGTQQLFAYHDREQVRTNLNAIGGNVGNYATFYNFAYNQTNLEVLKLTNAEGTTYNGSAQCNSHDYRNAFMNCPKLRRILDRIGMSAAKSMDRMFHGCGSLEYVWLHNIDKSISLEWSPKLSMESILYMIQNSLSNLSAVVQITLHPTAFARAAANADIQVALAEHPLIVLVQAPI